jgi:TRAP-type mannitol/chloroaromatic compound transport system permease large subunit
LKEKLTSFVGVLETLILFFMVMGGIFFGIFTPTLDAYEHRVAGKVWTPLQHQSAL